MIVAAESIGLPHIESRARDRLALAIEHTAHEVQDLPLGALRAARDDCEVGVLIERPRDGKKRSHFQKECGLQRARDTRHECIGGRDSGKRGGGSDQTPP